MESDTLKQRGKAFEDAFCRERDAQLLEALRKRLAAEDKKALLSKATGVAADAVLERLEACGIEVETLTAFSLYPMVAVAWADGVIHTNERGALLSAAEQNGLTSDDPNYELLKSWLDEEPDEQLHEAWSGYIKAVCAAIEPASVKSLKAEVMGKARHMAEAAGGILGIGNKVSSSEEVVLAKLERAFN